MELDTYYDEEPKFRTQNYQLPVMIKSPEDLTYASGYDFVKDAIFALDTALYDNDFPENNYRDLIDMDTLMERSAWAHCGILTWGTDTTRTINILSEPIMESTYFFARFFADPVFTAKYKARWNMHYSVIGVNYASQIQSLKTWWNNRIAYLNNRLV